MKLKISKQVFILSMVSLFTDLASEMLYPVTPIFLTSVLGSSMAVVGLIEGIAEVTSGLLKGYFGILSDKIGKRSIFVVLGYGVSALSKPLPGIFQNIPVVLSSRVSDRIGKGIRTAPRDALLASYSNGNSGAVFGFHRAMDTFGAALGPVVALLLLNFYPNNFQLIFWAAFIPSVIAVIFTLMVKDNTTSSNMKSKKSYLEFWRSAPKEYKRVLILLTIFSLVNSSDVFLILKSQDITHSNSLAIFGYVFYNIIYAASSFPLGSLADKFGKRNVFAAGLIIFSLVYFGFAFLSNINLIWILFSLYGIYAASTEGVSKAWIPDLIPDEQRGSAIGLLTMLSGFAVMLGSFFTGVLWDQFGSYLPFLISASISLVIAIFILLRKI
ncbi:MAG TPA: MFS transporter [Ignavibacteriaceae bacterium]|jgi:MFS family permease|nr:MAG: Tetracycline resistance protein, class C [Ignavibacteria bacterium ADurb.Bin266]OQY71631.1 MAG: MFS transporter [Ignavibacteriales bacterium UTCHB2]HQF41678.1 MFS transporter [Ignavibacteriaceae bacterium]HQI42039.1 MFS transporter [Ignavibacteriaceae bacterium]HQJ45512.1 MFS transporter [Ignavibacteriaceae bacterium]